MLISLEAAESISPLTVFGFGLALVFVGLICIILICMLMGALCKNLVKNQPAQPQKAAPTAVQAPAPIANKGEFAAAVSVAIAEDLGVDVSGIRILSVKQL